MPQGMNKDDSEISQSWDFVCLKGFGRLKVVASLDAYQITKYQILQKFIFCYLIFEKFEKELLNQGFSHFLPRHARSKSLFDFFKIVPLGVSSFFFKWF